jgi:hypothetical protein
MKSAKLSVVLCVLVNLICGFVNWTGRSVLTNIRAPRREAAAGECR